MIFGSVVSTTRGTLLKSQSLRNGVEEHWTGEDDCDRHKGPRDSGMTQRSPRFCSIWLVQVTSPCGRTGSTDRPTVLDIKVLGGRVWDKHTSQGGLHCESALQVAQANHRVRNSFYPEPSGWRTGLHPFP